MVRPTSPPLLCTPLTNLLRFTSLPLHVHILLHFFFLSRLHSVPNNLPNLSTRSGPHTSREMLLSLSSRDVRLPLGRVHVHSLRRQLRRVYGRGYVLHSVRIRGRI